MTKKKTIEILRYVLNLLTNIDLIGPLGRTYKIDYQRKITKAYDEIFELVKVLEADINNE